MSHTFTLSTSLFLCLLTGTTLAQEAPKGPKYPKFQFLRQGENWSAFRPQDQAGDLTDALKYIPLSTDGSTWLSIGGHLRARYESFNNFNFGLRPPDVGQDESYLLTRAILHADLHVGEHNRFFVETKTAQATERDLAPGSRRTIDVDSFDLQQGFWDHHIALDQESDLTLRVGRQGLLFGRQRLVSPLPWGNTLRAWDGFTAILSSGSSVTQAFYTQFAPVDISDFNEPEPGIAFSGVYSTHKWSNNAGGDLYGLILDRDQGSFNGTAGKEERYTLGGRVHGKLASSPLRYDFEAAYQLGRVGSGSVDAYMLAAELRYQPEEASYSPTFRLGLDVGSGDGGRGGNVGTFNQLFPLGHAYLGLIDVIGRQNIIDLSTGVSIKPHSRMTAGLDFHYFRLMDNQDALYNAGGGIVIPGGTSGSRSVGTELDLTLKYKVSRHTSTVVGFNHFIGGQVVEDGGGQNDTDFFYVSLQYTF